MSLTDRTKPSDVSLNTDLYELTMAQGYWEAGLVDTEACFTAFFRENPFNGGFAISCGTGQIADLVENFIFEDDDIDYLALTLLAVGVFLSQRFSSFCVTTSSM